MPSYSQYLCLHFYYCKDHYFCYFLEYFFYHYRKYCFCCYFTPSYNPSIPSRCFSINVYKRFTPKRCLTAAVVAVAVAAV